MNKRLVIKVFYGMLILAQCLFASGTLKGIVTDKEKNIPLIGANIFLEDTNIGAATDKDGKFVITGIKAGTYSVIISMIGYQQKSANFIINENQISELNIKLLPAVLQLSFVTVTGKAKRNLLENQKIESAGLELSTTIVTQKEIQRQGGKTLVDALNFIPGGLIETRGRKVKQFFSVRGQRYPYPEYSIDGVWQREFLETSYFFPATEVDRIEVIRSSAALLNGLNGMGGIINIIPKDYKAHETSFSLEYGSFGTYRSNISHGTKIGEISYAAGLNIQNSDGPAGLHAKENMMSFNGRIKWTPYKNLKIKYYLFHINGKRELRLAKPPANKRFLTELGSYDPVKSTLTNLKIDYKFTRNSNTEFLIYYSERDPVFVDEDEESHEVKRFLESDWEWGVNLTHSNKLSEQNTLRAGVLYNHWAAPNGKRFYYGKKNDLESISFVIVDEHNFGALNIDAGLRWSRTYINEYGGFGINGSGKGLSKVDAIKNLWKPPLLQVSFGGSYLLPNLYSVNFHTAVGEIKPLPGSLDIDFKEPKNETRIKLDLGVRKIWNSIGQLSLVGFLVHQNDAIVLSGEIYDTPTRYMELYLNRNQNQYGLEVEFRFTGIWNSVEVFFSTTMMNSLAEQDGEMEENFELPTTISSGGLFYQGDNLDVSLLAKYVSSFENTRFATAGLLPQHLGNFVTFDAIWGWNIYSKLYSTRFYLELKNITDIKYSTVVGYPDFGRIINVGIRQTIK